MREHPGFWVAGRSPRADPLTANVPGLGEALILFSFEEEARLYLGYGDEGVRPWSIRPDELTTLLLGTWSRFELVTLDPMPHEGAGIILRFTTIRRDDFLAHLVLKHGLGPWHTMVLR